MIFSLKDGVDSLTRDLSEVIFCFLDVETTGLDPYLGDRICEIAVLKTQGEQTLDVFHSLINPGRPISPGAYAVNHISADMVKDAPYFSELAQPFLDFIKETVLVGHNARFDMSFLATQLGGLNLPRPQNHVVD